MKARVLENPEIRKAASVKWKRVHAKQNQEISRKYSREYRRLHPERKAADERARRFAKSHAMPPWADRMAILKFYQEARRLTRETGIPHEVDHVWPLRGEGFVGLHVPWNLQILTASVNSSKKNRRPDIMEAR